MSISRDRSDDVTATIPLGPLLTRSGRFKVLFAEGMHLVEEAAGYLDGPGRDEARDLPAGLAEAYSAESMRLTSRLMQIASWLLIRRAVVDGEMTEAETARGRLTVTFTPQGRVSPQGIFLQLPLPLQRLTERSLRLQRRIAHLDRMVNRKASEEQGSPPTGLNQQFAMLRAAYGPIS